MVDWALLQDRIIDGYGSAGDWHFATNAITAGMSIAAVIIAVTVGWKLFKRFTK